MGLVNISRKQYGSIIVLLFSTPTLDLTILEVDDEEIYSALYIYHFTGLLQYDALVNGVESRN